MLKRKKNEHPIFSLYKIIKKQKNENYHLVMQNTILEKTMEKMKHDMFNFLNLLKIKNNY